MPQKYFDVLERALQNNNIIWLNNFLQNFDVTTTDEIGRTCLMFGCSNSSSPEVIKLFIDKILEVGGTALLRSQLAATDRHRKNCLIFAACGSSPPEVVKLFAALLRCLGLFKELFAKLKLELREILKEKSGIDSLSWVPSRESVAEVEILLEQGNFVNAIRNNQHSSIKEILKNDLNANNIINVRSNIIIRACSQLKTTTDTMMLLFSEIKRIGGGGGGGDQYLKELLSQENDAGEPCLLSVCLSYPDRLELILDTIEEVGGEEFLAEQLSKKRQRDGMSCLYAVCKFAPKYETLVFLVRKFFLLDRRYLRMELIASTSCLKCMFSRKFDSRDESKMLHLMMSLHLISDYTRLFEEEFSHLNEEKKQTLSFCKIDNHAESERFEWSRARSPMGDVIGEIKKSIKEQKKSLTREKVALVITVNAKKTTTI